MKGDLNIQDFVQGLQVAAPAKLRLGAALGINDLAGLVVAESQTLCPVAVSAEGGQLPGTLKKSVATDPATPKRLQATVAYLASYGAIVHEDLGAQHAVGQAKFLEIPMRVLGPQLPILVVRRCQEVMR